MSGLRLGCIADDFTGATDLANNLVRGGMRVMQCFDIPRALDVDNGTDADVDAIVIALKSRTAASDDAVLQSLAALAWLRGRGARQFYFKYCSTFDSTPRGNIGPVTDALMTALDTDFTIATPAFPDTGRTVYQGHLFVGDTLLQNSGMRDHPLTPMTDSNLLRLLQAQSTRQVGLIDHRVVAGGAAAIATRMAALRAQGVGIAVVDVLGNEDLLRLAPALQDMALVTASSGVAIGLPGNFGIAPSAEAASLPPAQGGQAIVCGSCSRATLRQVDDFLGRGGAAWCIDPWQACTDPPAAVDAALRFAGSRWAQGPVLVYSSAAAEAVQALQARLGVGTTGALIEQVLAQVARGLVETHGVRQLVVAGGETSGACVQALGIDRMRIGAQVDPGVPWGYAHDARGRGLHIALKSGNFGSVDFFTKAFAALHT